MGLVSVSKCSAEGFYSEATGICGHYEFLVRNFFYYLLQE